MFDQDKLQASTDLIFDTVRRAGEAILSVYNTNFSIQQKADRSPLTEADNISHEIIASTLVRSFPFPVLSEEGKDISFQERMRWDTFWLVDPLDGTKEFISRNGEFTVNVALIHKGRPLFGAIFVPVTDILYYAVAGKGSYKIMNGVTTRLPIRQEREGLAVVGSRSHGSSDFKEFVAELQSRHKHVALVSAGSSLKFCMVAEGTADIYPRLGPTMEWDTAAGQVIVEEAGGRVLEAGSSMALLYNKSSLVNPHFIARGRDFV
jgi:3'(2'), 5'-bisphosphate nucleotidase